VAFLDSLSFRFRVSVRPLFPADSSVVALGLLYDDWLGNFRNFFQLQPSAPPLSPFTAAGHPALGQFLAVLHGPGRGWSED
jgi:hypothetical protein